MNKEQVNVRRFDANEVMRNWSWVSALLAPSVRIAGREVDDVKLALLRGEMGLASVHAPGGAGLIVVHPGMFDGVFACWLAFAALRLKSGPKAWVRTVREVMGYLEDQARAAGCVEMRIGGRDWSRALVGYEPLDGIQNGLRKFL